MAPFNLRFEMSRFLLYCLFPVGSLYIYNRPELQESFLFRDQVNTYKDLKLFEEDPKALFKIPKTKEETEKYLEDYKQRMRQARINAQQSNSEKTA